MSASPLAMRGAKPLRRWPQGGRPRSGATSVFDPGLIDQHRVDGIEMAFPSSGAVSRWASGPASAAWRRRPVGLVRHARERSSRSPPSERARGCFSRPDRTRSIPEVEGWRSGMWLYRRDGFPRWFGRHRRLAAKFGSRRAPTSGLRWISSGSTLSWPKSRRHYGSSGLFFMALGLGA